MNMWFIDYVVETGHGEVRPHPPHPFCNVFHPDKCHVFPVHDGKRSTRLKLTDKFDGIYYNWSVSFTATMLRL